VTKELKRITLTISDERELMSTLVKLSKQYGGAWVFNIVPFSHKTHFLQYKNPSSVPDYFSDWTHNRMAYQGKIRGFTPGAIHREQQRGYGGDS
jgi:hypothetical protein